MIRVIIERRLKKKEDIGRLLMSLRMTAMLQKGYISSETLVNTENKSVIIVISNWNRLEDWKAWNASEKRQAIEKQIDALLSEKEIVNTYEIMSPEEEEYLEDPSSWLAGKERPHLHG
jgi:quinol monooxygenase YgiN